MKKLTSIFESRNSLTILQSELNEYNKKMSKKLPKPLMVAMQLIEELGITDKDVLDNILSASKPDLELLSKTNKYSLPKLLDLSKLLKAQKDKLKLLPFYQTQFERDMLLKGKLSTDDVLMDLETDLGRNIVAKQYMPLVHKIVNSFDKRTPLSKSELLSAALEGLTIAMNRYKKPDRDIKPLESELDIDNEDLEEVSKEEVKKKEQTFVQYAAYIIRFYILNEISHSSRTVRMSKNDVKAAMAAGESTYNFVSIDKSVSKRTGSEDNDGGAGILDILPELNTDPDWNPDFDEDKSWKKIFDKLSKVFPARDMNVFYKYWGMNGFERKKGKDIAKELNVSAPTITHIIAKIIKYMSTINDPDIKDMLDDLYDSYMNECLVNLPDYSVKTIEESLLSDPILMIFEDMYMLKGGLRWETPTRLAFDKINNSKEHDDKKFVEYLLNCIDEDFEYLDSNYKKFKDTIVKFLMYVNPTIDYTRESDFTIIEDYRDILEIIKKFKINK